MYFYNLSEGKDGELEKVKFTHIPRFTGRNTAAATKTVTPGEFS